MSSADIIASNDDIIVEILLHLPAKSLPKFRSVCRRWLHLISEPNFRVCYNRRHARSVSGFILARKSYQLLPRYTILSLSENNSAKIQTLDLSFHPNAVILQSFNGLIFCSSQGLAQRRRYFVLYPTTGGFFVVPEPKPVWGKCARNCFNLAYDPIVSSVYQVVNLQIYKSSCHVQIYSSETGNWRDVGKQNLGSYSSAFQHGVFWNGGIHWVNSSDGNSWRFDIENETLQAMPRPPLPQEWNSHNFRHFLESQGHLFFISFHSPEYIICEMEKGCSKWSVKHRLDINLIFSTFPGLRTRDKEISSNDPLLELANLVSLVSIVELGDEGLSLVMYIPGRFVSYSFKVNSLKTLCSTEFEYPSLKCIFPWYNTHNYMNTLLSDSH